MKAKFKIGDKVFSYSLQEWGEVKKVYLGELYPVIVEFPEYGNMNFTEDGRRSKNDKAPDLFFDEVSIEPQQRALQDKDIVMCWDEYAEFEVVYRFYNSVNKSTWGSDGTRGYYKWNYMIYVPDEEAPQELIAMRDKLKDK